MLPVEHLIPIVIIYRRVQVEEYVKTEKAFNNVLEFMPSFWSKLGRLERNWDWQEEADYDGEDENIAIPPELERVICTKQEFR